MIIYLDLDGVFADFESAVKRLTGQEYNPKLTWPAISKVPNFFRELYPLSGALPLFDQIYNNNRGNVKILTASPIPTGKLATVVEDKVAWCKTYLHPNVDVIVCTEGWSGKKKYAQGNLLVDDSLRNINDWVAHGGAGIHHTSNYNTRLELKMMGLL